MVIACSNVANLLLARGVRRARELTVRLSLGATRGRIVRQLLTETSMLAGLGGLAGLAVAAGALRLFTAAIPSNGLPYWIIFTMDARVFAALAAVCLGAVLLSGLAPAVQLARTNVTTSLKETSASVSGSLGARRWTWVFLTAQLGFTVILLSAVGMTVQGFYALQRRGPTIDAAHLLTFGITLPPDGYRTPAQRDAFFRTLDDRLTGSPGVLAMSRASTLPANLGQPRRLIVAGQTTASAPVVRATSIDEHYFRTLGLSLVAGRPFDRTDLVDARPVAVVNQRFAEMFLPDGSAVGHTIRLAGFDARAGDAGEARTVVGIAPSVHRQPTVEHEPVIYLPMAAAGTANASWLLRTDGDPRALVPLVREEVRRLDANVPVHSVATLKEANWQARWNARVSFGLIFAIAFVALALATIGLAAMTAQAVTQRTRELGIRLALGAAGSHVVALVLRRVALQIAVGLLVGAIGAHAWGRVFATPGFATAGNLTAVALLVIAVTMGVAAAIARRAARIDPLSALRYE